MSALKYTACLAVSGLLAVHGGLSIPPLNRLNSQLRLKGEVHNYKTLDDMCGLTTKISKVYILSIDNPNG